MKLPKIKKKWDADLVAKIAMTLILLAAALLAMQLSISSTYEEKLRERSDKTAIYVVDPSGQTQLTSAVQSEEKKFEHFAQKISKKMFTFTYVNDNDRQKYLEQYLDKDQLSELNLQLRPLYEEIKQVSGSYRMDIEQIETVRKGGSFIIDIYFQHELVSKGSQDLIPSVVRLEMTNSTPNATNLAGVFVKSWELKQSEARDEQKKISDERYK